MVDVGISTSSSTTVNSSTCNVNNNDNDDVPMSPIRERTKKAIAQHRAWRQPDLRRSYAGISVSASSQRQLTAPKVLPTKKNTPSHSISNGNIRSAVIPNVTQSHSGGSCSIPFDAAAAIYEDIELSERRLLHNDDFNDNEHLRQIESSMLSPSLRSNISSTSDRSINDDTGDDKLVDTSASNYSDNHVNRLGIAANKINDNDPTNEVELLKRQQYVYESYRTLNQSSMALEQIDATTTSESQPQQQQPMIVFRDDESAGTGMSQQELIRKKARTSRRKRLGNKTKRPILQLPVQLLLPPRISTPQRQAYRTIHQQDAPFSTLKQHRKGNNKSTRRNNYYDHQYNDPEEEMESSSTTAETANESGDSPPGTGSFASAILPQQTRTIPKNRPRRQPTLAVRGDDALLWVDPIDQRSIGDDSLTAAMSQFDRQGDRGVNCINNKYIMEESVLVKNNNEHPLPPKSRGKSSTVVQLPKTSVRFARSNEGCEDDESSMPWDQKTDLNVTATLTSPSSVLENIKEETPESLEKSFSTPAAVVPKSILRKSRYTTSQTPITNDDIVNDFIANQTNLEGNNHNQDLYDLEVDQHERIIRSRDLSPPRMSIGMVDIEGLELSPIPPGLDSENQSIVDDNNVDDVNVPQPYKGIGHPAEKHIQQTMATFLAMRHSDLADHVRDQENYPDPPLEIDVDDDETVLSAYVFIETVAAIVIQTAVRQFLAILYLDSLRQTRDSFEVAQRVLSIEEGCIEESMITSSRATSSTESEQIEYSYENLIDDDLDRAAVDMYELAAIQIQSVYRGFWVRDCLDVDHYCATVLQRMYRGLLSRRAFARDIWRIVLVQSWCRRNIARDSAANILAYAIVIQSAVRSHIARKRNILYREKKLLIQHAAATSIQSRWRSFVCEAHFIRSLVDVLIVQTVVRKWLAHQKVVYARRDRKLAAEQSLYKSTLMSQVSTIVASNDTGRSPELKDDTCLVSIPKAVAVNTGSAQEYSLTPNSNLNGCIENSVSDGKLKSLSNMIPPPSPHVSSAKIVNKKSMDVNIVNDSKWRTAAARCITPETKKMYTKSKVIAYPISDDEGSSCNESYKIVRNTGPATMVKQEDSIDSEVAMIQKPVEPLVVEDGGSTNELLLEVPRQGTTTNLLSIWKEKEKRNGYPYRKALT